MYLIYMNKRHLYFVDLKQVKVNNSEWTYCIWKHGNIQKADHKHISITTSVNEWLCVVERMWSSQNRVSWWGYNWSIDKTTEDNMSTNIPKVPSAQVIHGLLDNHTVRVGTWTYSCSVDPRGSVGGGGWLEQSMGGVECWGGRVTDGFVGYAGWGCFV